MEKCYCGSNENFKNCCEPKILNKKTAETPEELMRSRYAAYVIQNADYLIATTHISQRKYYSVSEILEWAKENSWIKLEVLNAEDCIVEFKAYYLDENGEAQVHHEKSTFKLENEKWYYVDGVFFN